MRRGKDWCFWLESSKALRHCWTEFKLGLGLKSGVFSEGN